MTVYTTFNGADHGTQVSNTLSNGGLTLNNPGSQSANRAFDGKSTGKFYFEAHLDTQSGNNVYIGLTPLTNTTLNQPGVSSLGIAWLALSSGIAVTGGSGSGTGAPAGSTGTTAGFAFDFAHGLWVTTNGTTWNAGGTANPTTGVGASTWTGVTPLYPTEFAGLGNGQTFNFGASAFHWTLPTGFTSGWPANIQPADATQFFL